MTYTDERGTFILRWTRRLKNGHIQRAVGKPFKIYIKDLCRLAALTSNGRGFFIPCQKNSR